jgi:hypothetical protein
MIHLHLPEKDRREDAMFPTMEVRWFRPGEIPAAIQEWFQRCKGEPEEQQPRVDYYFHSAADDSLGIKLREGRLEVKRRRRRLGIVHFHERVAGQVEHWRKWGFAYDIERDGPWPSGFYVKKDRSLYRYRLAKDREIEAVSSPAQLGPGCELELTQVSARGQTWWTLAFEAYGHEVTIHDILFLTVHHLFAANAPPTLDPRDSYGYPRWLEVVQLQNAS